ncbi:glycosyltransferase [Evansella tamaricis]|uniref:Glycosyltransferase n=1 Tax=Evansella tamaricis TaxID=2069301 RepID=A0ABS6JIY1_9BACI|nr:glycosyltransferase [Evansella tamaricis]MBU9713493.1 glycosyltransferase [Evansella tamaricis]
MVENKIALYIPTLNGGGAERMIINLAKSFNDKGYNVELIVSKYKGPYISLLPDNLPIVDLNVSKGYMALPGLIKYLKNNKPDVILSALSLANIICLLAKQFSRVNTRVIVSERNHLSSAIRNSRNYKLRLIPFFIKKLYPKADKVVTISNGIANDLIAYCQLPETNITTIYNPAYTTDILEKGYQKLNNKIFYEETHVILGVGRLVPQKDFPTLIKAFKIVNQKVKAKLVILGEGSERGHLEKIVKDLDLENDVILPGFVNNPFAYMSNASLFVLSSAWEGFGNVLVEAMACGVGVVSTNCPSGPSEILEDGKFGTLVEVGDEIGMANAIIDYLRKPKDSGLLKDRAMDFSLEKISEQYLNILFPNNL